MNNKTSLPKLLSSKELATKLHLQQKETVARLQNVQPFQPQLAIIQVKDDPVINTYVRLKQRYGATIGCTVTVHTIAQSNAITTITALNNDPTVHGIIVQLPLDDPSETQNILNHVAKHKDVDGLADISNFIPATPTAIMWLLQHYKIALTGPVAVIGKGRLVGDPLVKLLQKQGINPTIIDRSTKDVAATLQTMQVIITAAGSPGLVTSAMVAPDTVVIDAGTSTDGNSLVGDVAPAVGDRNDVHMTPHKGGIGPLTVCALFENVLTAAQNEQT